MAPEGAKPSTEAMWKRTTALRAQRAGRPRLSDQGLETLVAHKYKPGPYTPLDHLLYRFWWTPLSEWLPRWLAPNALTLAGAAAAYSSAGLLWSCSLDFKAGPPVWAEVVAALLLFFYQTCDALDGLQARRTGASSPLGELLDHGCDCVCLSACTLGYCASLQYGFSVWTFIALCMSWAPWYLAQWESYTTGIIRTGGELFGITEIEFVVIGIHVLSALFGSEFWSYRVPILGLWPNGLELRYACVGIQAVSVTLLSSMSVLNVLVTTETWTSKVAALRRAMPLVVLSLFSLLWPLTLPGCGERFICLAICALFTRLAAEAIVCHMTLEEYPSWQSALALLPAVYALGLLGLLQGFGGQAGLLLYTVFCVYEAVRYITDVILEITTHLGVRLLKIGPRVD